MAKMKKRIGGAWVETADTFPVKVGEVSALQEKMITPSEQAQEIEADSGFTGLRKVIVNAISNMFVGSGVQRQSENTIVPTTTEQIAVQSGVYTTGRVKVAAIQTEEKTITENGTYTPTTGRFFSTVDVAIPFSTIYYGSSVPDASFGNDGDIYIKR